MGVTAITNTIVNKGFPNGTEWTLTQSGIQAEYGIRFLNGAWYILGYNGIWKSQDGFTYTQWAFTDESVQRSEDVV